METQKILNSQSSLENEEWSGRNQSHSPLQQKKIKYLGINLPKETKELHTENYKTLMKEIKDDINREIFHVLG